MTTRTAAPPAEADPEPPEDSYTSDPVPWLEALAADTPEEEVHQRQAVGRGGVPVTVNGQPLMLAYVTARYVQDRLDNVVGPMNWANMFDSLADGVRCGIGIRAPGSDQHDPFLWKWDVGTPSSIEGVKGAHSDAFKRAGVLWGIARDLYDERDDRHAADPAGAQPVQGTIQQQVQGAPQPVPQAAPQQSEWTQPTQAQALPGAPPIRYSEDGQAQAQVTAQTVDGKPAWVCPIHQDVKEVPAGISRKNNRPYNAFLACPVPGCDQKQPFGPR